MKKGIILIDCGHGIDTPGKRSPDGKLLEYLFNRQVGEYAFRYLEEAGFRVAFVVDETNDIPLSTRVRRVNKVCARVGAKNVILLSLHADAYGNGREWTSANGWAAWTSKGNTESDHIASALYKAFEEEFADRRIRRNWADGDPDYEENFYLLTKTKCPAVLLENFFYTNKEECAFMLEEATKKRIARAIVNGLLYYYAEKQ